MHFFFANDVRAEEENSFWIKFWLSCQNWLMKWKQWHYTRTWPSHHKASESSQKTEQDHMRDLNGRQLFILNQIKTWLAFLFWVCERTDRFYIYKYGEWRLCSRNFVSIVLGNICENTLKLYPKLCKQVL